MMRAVRAKDGRAWTVQSRISWTMPTLLDQFEHDMAAGYVHGIAMLGVIGVLALFVVFWTPPGVVIPAWFVLFILLILLLVPVLWASQRPWIVTARTDEPMGTEGEYWEGTVRGVVMAREETRRVAEDLRERGTPGDGTGVLSRISSPTLS